MASHGTTHRRTNPRRATRIATRIASRLVSRLVAITVTGVLAGSMLGSPANAAVNPVTPGNFTGYGFDQCLTPTQDAMTAWLRHSKFWAVGVYLSGDSRACRDQPNLTAGWVNRQLADGWRLLPITLGPQASCNPRFPRYDDDETIEPTSANRYRAARLQGRAEAADAVTAARRLGIRAGSTLWYDMEAYDITERDCRESALWFTSAWTEELHRRGYVSGVYSSAGSHLKALDDVRVDRPAFFALPDRIWLARWDGVPNTSTPLLRPDGWLPGDRLKQYRGGHNETHGGVTIDIDSNWLNLGRGSKAGPEPKHCGGVRLNYGRFPKLRSGSTGQWVRAAQCLLRQAGYYRGGVTGTVTKATQGAIRRHRVEHRLSNYVVVDRRMWTSLLAEGSRSLVKYGGAGERVRRLQRAVNAATGMPIPVTGTFDGTTHQAVKRYQRAVDLPATGVATPEVWARLQAARVW